MIRGAFAFVKVLVRNFERKHLPLAAAGAAFYFLMSIFPGLIAIAAAITYLPLQNGVQGTASLIAYVIPQQFLPLMEHLLGSIRAHDKGLLSFVLITTLWVASMGFKGIILGIEMVYDAHPPRPLWISRLLAFGITLAVGLLLLLGVILTLAGPFLAAFFHRTVSAQSPWAKIWPYFQWSLSVALIFAAIELLYLVGPNVPGAQRLTIPGAVVATASWISLAWGFGLYLHHFGQLKLDMLYGALATPVACMIWLNLNAAAILLGAEINSILYNNRTKTASLSLSPSAMDAGQKAHLQSPGSQCVSWKVDRSVH